MEDSDQDSTYAEVDINLPKAHMSNGTFNIAI